MPYFDLDASQPERASPFRQTAGSQNARRFQFEEAARLGQRDNLGGKTIRASAFKSTWKQVSEP